MGFDEKAATWDASKRRRELAKGVAQGVKDSISLDKSMQILDFGAGTGLLTREIIESVATVTGVDSSEKMLEKFREIGDSCITVHCDINKYQPNRAFDGIISSMTMHHIEDIEALFLKLYSLLKPGGFIAIADLREEDGTFHDGGNEGVCHFGFDTKKLEDIAKSAGFKSVKSETVYSVSKGEREYPIFLLTAKK